MHGVLDVTVPSKEVIDAYCDGSAYPLAALERYHSRDTVGRIMIIIPALDYGLLERFHNPVNHELAAIVRADAICREKITEVPFVIHSDHEGAIKKSRLLNVRFSSPDEFHIADAMLKRIVRRAYYLRHSERTVKRRKPETALHSELVRLWKAERLDFKLSESHLHASFQSKAEHSESFE